MTAIKTSLVLAAAFVGLVGGPAQAEELIVARVPFEFMVGSQQLTAGRYEIVTDAAGNVRLHGLDHRAVSVALTIPAGGSDPTGDKPALVFTRWENEYRLSEVWDSGTEGYSLMVPALHHRTKSTTSVSQPSDRLAYVVEADLK